MRSKSEKGVTLVELLAAISIASIVLWVILSMIYQSQFSFSQITTRENVQEEARQITEHMINTIRKKPYIVTQNLISGDFLVLTDSQSRQIKYRFEPEDHRISVIFEDGSSMVLSEQVTNDSIAELAQINNNQIKLRLEFKRYEEPPYVYETKILLPEWKK